MQMIKLSLFTLGKVVFSFTKRAIFGEDAEYLTNAMAVSTFVCPWLSDFEGNPTYSVQFGWCKDPSKQVVGLLGLLSPLRLQLA